MTPKLRRIILSHFKAGLSTATIAEEEILRLSEVEQVIREALRKQDVKK